MQARDFCFWLQGYFEISGNAPLDENQVNTIQKHLGLVFEHMADAPKHEVVPDGVVYVDAKPLTTKDDVAEHLDRLAKEAEERLKRPAYAEGPRQHYPSPMTLVC